MKVTILSAQTRKPPQRKPRGGSILELGPALLVLFIFILFPMLDFTSFTVAYISAYTMNTEQVREAALSNRATALDPNGKVRRGIPSWYSGSGLGRFVNMQPVAPLQTQVSYASAVSDNRPGFAASETVFVRTTVAFRPFLYVALPIRIAGLNADYQVTFVQSRPVESS